MRYASWRKCDFQVHTPRDPNWVGPRPVGLDAASVQDVDAERAQWADQFIDQCAANHLRAVALTDHHEMIMVPYVQRAIEKRASSDPSFDLWLFPAMELTVKGGKQCIIIFDANLSEDWRKQAQGKLGIVFADLEEKNARAPRVTQIDCSYPEIANSLDQLEDLRGKYIVLPNVSQGNSHTVLTDGAHKDFLRMPYVGGYLDDGQTICTLSHKNQRRLSGSDRTWSLREIYPLPTSDSRSSDFSTLGTNNTWIKIAEPTAEAIRQAFLGHKSRIRIEQPKLPSSVVAKAEVDGSTILQTTALSLSPEFNAVIGGRGSGKSTFLEYVAFALGRSCYDMPRDRYSGTRRMRDLIEDSLVSRGGRISLEVQMDNAPFRIVRGPDTQYQPQITYSDGTTETVAVTELRRLFPAVVYSQGELADVGGKGDEETQLSDLLQFVNPDYKRRDDQFDLDIKAAKAAVKSAIQAVVEHWRRQSTLRQLTTRVVSLTQRADALEKTLPERSQEDQATLAHFDKMNEFNSKVIQASKHADQILQRLEAVVSELRTERDLSTSLEGVVTGVQQSYHDLYKAFESGVTDLRSDLAARRATLKTASTEWDVKFDDALKRRNGVLEKLGNQRTATRQIIKLREEITELNSQTADLVANPGTQGDPSNRLEAVLARLREINYERDQRTQEWAATIRSLSSGRIRASVTLAANTEEITGAINTVSYKTGSHEVTRTKALEQALRDRSASGLVDRLSKDCLDLLRWRQMDAAYGIERPQCIDLMSVLGETERIQESVTALMSIERIEAIATAVAKPAIDLRYRDRDREISFAKASDGQRAAALLFMLLEQPAGPLIIDQPEGDLDNRIIADLTDKLHEAKEKRQLVFASHNANLVVNGSAELVAHLDINSSGDREFACTGAIDKPDVCRVITSTMEGGEKAFKDRQHKYGY